MNSFTLEVFQSEEQIMTCFLKLQFGPHIFLRPPMAGQTWAPEPSPISTVEIMRFDIIGHMLNCKLNSTNGGTFSNSAEKNYF